MTVSARPQPPTSARPAAPGRKQRSDGAEARTHLLLTALRLFSEKGFAKTSTREIAQAAGANSAAISYYFGDKAGLYRAVFCEPLGSAGDDIALYNQPHFSLRESLTGFFNSFLEPMKQGELIELSMRLHFREMLEPTGLWAAEIDSGIRPAHAALMDVLRRHLGVARADDELHRMTFSISALAVHLFVARDVIQVIRPELLGTSGKVDAWGARLVDYAEAMVATEAARRRPNTRGKP
jgi:TetR/AcrR family transcriptional regulator, regulator of cefoperazone and chloramphenicol sensitivity